MINTLHNTVYFECMGVFDGSFNALLFKIPIALLLCQLVFHRPPMLVVSARGGMQVRRRESNPSTRVQLYQNLELRSVKLIVVIRMSR